MDIAFRFSELQHQLMYRSMLEVQANPYTNYLQFKEEVSEKILTGKVPDEFIGACELIHNTRSSGGRADYLFSNCPIDEAIPPFNHTDPVSDKYLIKKTFVGEGLLEALSQLTKTPLLAYETRNNGDFFHDVYAFESYTRTQTQKTDGELYYHNDRTAHPVRADYLSLLGMHCSSSNQVYTGYLCGSNLIHNLSEDHQSILREKMFFTPFDEYSKDSNHNQQVSDPHCILEEAHCFRYYDTRTKPLKDAPSEAWHAIDALRDAIVKADKKRVHIGTRDLFTFPNQSGLHNRDLVHIVDPDIARKRWLLKTYSFRSPQYMSSFNDNFEPGIEGLVRESVTDYQPSMPVGIPA